MAFPTPITHAAPGAQPLVPSPGCVMKEPGCVCFFRPKIIPKMTRKPAIDKKRVACVILGTDRGKNNKGAAAPSTQKETMPETDTTQREIPEQVMIHHPSKVIQPTTKAANRLLGRGARMKTK
ncbi:MAG: hypothetical protein Q9187_002001 [Circinaria calcarea]